jgi:hypothetical protein
LFAVALEDGSKPARSQAGKRAQELARHLFEAARHSLNVSRLQNDRTRSRRRASR